MNAYYHQRESDFAAASKAFKEGQIVIAEFNDGRRDIVNELHRNRNHGHEFEIVTLAGRVTDWRSFASFTDLRAAQRHLFGTGEAVKA